MCAETFEFAGAARLAEQMAERPEVDKSLEAKAQLESYYTKHLTPSANPKERFSNLRQRRAELRAADPNATVGAHTAALFVCLFICLFVYSLVIMYCTYFALIMTQPQRLERSMSDQ